MRKILLLVSVLALSFTGLIGFGSSAQAVDRTCPANRFCLFQDKDYKGGRAVFNSTRKHLGDRKFDNGVVVGDRASSMINNKTNRVALYEHGDCSGDQYNARGQSRDGDLHEDGMGDKASCLVVI